MEGPSRALTQLAPSSPAVVSILRRRRTSTDSHSPNSPEFEFWRNPSAFPQSPLHSADELFSDGFLLPLHHLHPNPDPKRDEPDQDPDPAPEPEPSPVLEESEQSISAAITSSAGNPILTASKRWKEIFKRGDKKPPAANTDETTKIKPEKPEKKREKIRSNSGNPNGNNNNNNNNGGNSGSAELNINLWPFSRSRSSGNNSSRSKPAASRKVSSAPCSRSNSSGESKSSRRSWPSSPGRTGVHLGRSSPVVQIRRSRNDDGRRKAASNPAGKGRVLNLNVPMCIGYRQQLSCRIDEDGGGGGGAADSGNGSNSNLFSLRGLFGKKSVLTA